MIRENVTEKTELKERVEGEGTGSRSTCKDSEIELSLVHLCGWRGGKQGKEGEAEMKSGR